MTSGSALAPRTDAERLLCDVVALTTLPTVWIGASPQGIARSLADALERCGIDSVAVLLKVGEIELDAVAGDERRAEAALGAFRQGVRPSPGEAVPIGAFGARGTILVAGCDADRVFLARLAANLAEMALRARESALDAQASREGLLRLEKLSALGQLVSGVAHELRTPLTYANNALHLATTRLSRADGIAPEDRAHVEAMLADVLDAHERIARTVSTLRRLSSPRTSTRSDVVLSETVAEATRLFALTHVGAVGLRTRFEGTASVRADPIELQQVVLNLLQNAAEAAPDQVRIDVSTADGNGVARLVVEDDGPGIPAEVQGRVFEPFFTTKSTGMGLGLSIVRRIVEGHGGTIAIGASPLGGARVEVAFPQPDARDAARDPAAGEG